MPGARSETIRRGFERKSAGVAVLFDRGPKHVVCENVAFPVGDGSPAGTITKSLRLKVIGLRISFSMNIVLYRKSGCPWSAAVMGFLDELNLPYEIRNVTSQPQYAKELEEKFGQCKSPSLDLERLTK